LPRIASIINSAGEPGHPALDLAPPPGHCTSDGG